MSLCFERTILGKELHSYQVLCKIHHLENCWKASHLEFVIEMTLCAVSVRSSQIWFHISCDQTDVERRLCCPGHSPKLDETEDAHESEDSLSNTFNNISIVFSSHLLRPFGGKGGKPEVIETRKKKWIVGSEDESDQSSTSSTVFPTRASL